MRIWHRILRMLKIRSSPLVRMQLRRMCRLVCVRGLIRLRRWFFILITRGNKFLVITYLNDLFAHAGAIFLLSAFLERFNKALFLRTNYFF